MVDIDSRLDSDYNSIVYLVTFKSPIPIDIGNGAFFSSIPVEKKYIKDKEVDD
jgi:hypothetical protein